MPWRAALYRQEKLDQEDDRKHIGQGRDLPGLAREQLDAGEGDQRQTDAVADGAGNGHGQQHDRHGQQLGQVVKVDLLQVAEHQNTHIDQGGGGGRGGDQSGDGREEDAQQEENAGGDGRQTGATAGGDAGGGFHKGGDGGGAGEGTGHGADGVGQQGFLHLGHPALLVQHAGLGGRAHQRADGVEHINDAEGDDQRHNGEPADGGEAGKIQLEQGGLRHVAEGGQEGGRLQALKGIGVHKDGLAGPVDAGAAQNAVKHRAADLFVVQRHDDEQAGKHGDDLEDHLAVAAADGLPGGAGGERAEEITHYEEGAALVGIDAGIGAEADVHQHQADGGADAQPHAQRDGFHDLFPDIEDGEDQEDHALHQNDHQSRLEGAQIGHARETRHIGHHQGKKAVETHAGRHGEGLVGQKAHADGADGGSDAGGQKHAVPEPHALCAEAGEQVGVQGDDVRHGHKGGQARRQLGADGGAPFFQMKQRFHCGLSLFQSICAGRGARTQRFQFTGLRRIMQPFSRGFFKKCAFFRKKRRWNLTFAAETV